MHLTSNISRYARKETSLSYPTRQYLLACEKEYLSQLSHQAIPLSMRERPHSVITLVNTSRHVRKETSLSQGTSQCIQTYETGDINHFTRQCLQAGEKGDLPRYSTSQCLQACVKGDISHPTSQCIQTQEKGDIVIPPYQSMHPVWKKDCSVRKNLVNSTSKDSMY